MFVVLTTKRSLDIGNFTFRETCFAKAPQFKTPHRPSVLSKTHPLHITTILFADSKKNMDTHVVDTNTQKYKRNECVYIGYCAGTIFR